MANEEDDSPGGAARGEANLVVAILVHVVVGGSWFFLVVGVALLFGEGAAGVWALCGGALWILGAVNAVRRRADAGRVWSAVLRSWLWMPGGPISLAVVGIQRLGSSGATYEPPRPVTRPVALESPEEPVNPELERRLDVLGQRIDALSRELTEIRRLAQTGAAQAPLEEPPRPEPAPRPPPPAPKPAPPPELRGPSWWERDWGELLGAQGLAWAGGIVTVLGVVFFFVLAANRGWIGPVERVSLGAIASASVFGAGLYLHRRYGPTYAAYGAVGAGLAGGYATLLASAALYDLVSDLGALAIAASIAAVGVATALYWGSELIAGIGLVGATLVPLMVLFEEDISTIGTAFAGIVFTATAIVAVVRRWPVLLGVGFAASALQIALLVGDGAVTDWDRVILAWIFAALYVAAAHALNRKLEEGGLHSLSATLVLVAALLAGMSGAVLFDGDNRGWVVVGSGLAFVALGAVLYFDRRDRDFSALLGAAGLGLVGVGLAVVLTGPSLALAWAAEAAVLAWLAQRILEPRYQLLALAYLAAATVYAFAFAAPPTDLYEAVENPADGALAPLAVAIAGAVTAFYSRPWPEQPGPSGFFAYLEPVLAPFREFAAELRVITGWLAGAAALYAASLGVLELSQRIGTDSVEARFERGHIFVTLLWGLTAAALTYGSNWLGSFQVRAAGLSLAVATLLEAVFFDVTFEENRRGWAFLAAALPLLLTAFAEELPATEEKEIEPSAALLAPVSAAVAAVGLAFVVEGSAGPVDAEGLAWLCLAAVYALLAAWTFPRDRDFSTALWAPALVVGVAASIELLSNTWLVLAWSAVGAALAIVGDRIGEERLQLGAAGYLALALGYTLGELAPPGEFFSANEDPATGVPALLCSIAALVVFVRFGLRREPGKRYRLHVVAGAAVLAIYAVSLAILGAFQEFGSASVETDFQRGHSAVSAFWGVVGLITLYVGLTRDLRTVRLAGFALFGLALAKLFLYDLANLSSVTRALSFLAVGAVLLLAGFFYQRLTAAIRDT